MGADEVRVQWRSPSSRHGPGQVRPLDPRAAPPPRLDAGRACEARSDVAVRSLQGRAGSRRHPLGPHARASLRGARGADLAPRPVAGRGARSPARRRSRAPRRVGRRALDSLRLGRGAGGDLPGRGGAWFHRRARLAPRDRPPARRGGEVRGPRRPGDAVRRRSQGATRPDDRARTRVAHPVRVPRSWSSPTTGPRAAASTSSRRPSGGRSRSGPWRCAGGSRHRSSRRWRHVCVRRYPGGNSSPGPGRSARIHARPSVAFLTGARHVGRRQEVRE